MRKYSIHGMIVCFGGFPTQKNLHFIAGLSWKKRLDTGGERKALFGIKYMRDDHSLALWYTGYMSQLVLDFIDLFRTGTNIKYSVEPFDDGDNETCLRVCTAVLEAVAGHPSMSWTGVEDVSGYRDMSCVVTPHGYDHHQSMEETGETSWDSCAMSWLLSV